MTPDPQTTTVRVRSPGSGLSRIVLVLVVAAALGAVQEDQWWLTACAAVVTVLSVALVVHTAASSAQATADGLVSRSPWRRPRRLRWKQIDRFEVRGFWNVLGVWTTDEHWMPLFACAAFTAEGMAALGRLEECRRWQSGS